MKKIAMVLLLMLTLGMASISAYGGNPRNECPYCGAPSHFTGQRGYYYSNSWDVYECSNGHRYDVPD
jgi:hypothetical protein